MINDLFLMNGYGIFVWSSFVLTFLACAIVYYKTRKTLKKYEKEFAKEIVKTKLKERHHFIDNSQEIKRWKNGFLGEFAVEKFLGKRFVDLSIGSSKSYFIPDLSPLGVDWGIKTVEKGKFPIIFKKSYKGSSIGTLK